MEFGVSRATSAIVGLAALALSSACGSSATTATAPTPLTRCAVTLSGTGNVPAQGGAGTITVSAARECAWTATADGQWLSIKSGATGQGEGTVEYAAALNPDPSVRRGAVVLNEQRLEVTQQAGECRLSLGESSASFPQTGGTGRIDLRASSGQCEWSAEANVGWIVLGSAARGKGSAQIPFDVTATTGPPRSGTVTVGGQRFEIAQSEGCAYVISPAAYSATAGGGSGAITVSTSPGCPWSAGSNASWLTLGQSSSTGSGTVPFTVAASSGGARTTTAVIAGQTFTVTQAAASPAPPDPGTPDPGPPNPPPPGPAPPTPAPPAPTPEPCTFTVDPRSVDIDPNGGSFTVTVTTASRCSWTASSDSSWITLTSPGSASGNGTARFSVASGGSSARTGSVKVAGETVTVRQAAAAASCRFEVRPRDIEVDSDDDGARIDVDASREDCEWTASSDVSWVRIVWGWRGTGDGVVGLYIADNDGKKRKGEITVAGVTVKIEQRGDD